MLPGGGMVIDRPGIRELQLWESAGGHDAAFADVDELAAECRFNDCAQRTSRTAPSVRRWPTDRSRPNARQLAKAPA